MRSPIYTQSPWEETYSEIIDVRSEGEFTEDRIPGAINLPVLNNEERARVGTIYKQISPFEARKIGASLVAQNISRHLSSHFAGKDKQYSPLIYCWRGGQRSSSMAMVLCQIGWQVNVVKGGYQTYRTYVREQLSELPQKFTYKVLCGLTGTGKTHILQRLLQRGEQVLDLESLANHRGSLLGQEWEEKPEPQPSQKGFESLLLQRLKEFDPNQLVWVESESNKIGQIHLPKPLWQMMKQASCVEVQLPQEERIKWLLQQYCHIGENPDFLKSKLQMLKSRYGMEKIEQWNSLIDQKRGQELVADLLTHHYDPSYRRSLNKIYASRIEQVLAIPDLSDASLDNALFNQVLSLNFI